MRCCKHSSLQILLWLVADQQLKDDADPKERGWFTNLLTGPSSSLALAFLCNKALMPVRAPITLGLTPMVARYALEVLHTCDSQHLQISIGTAVTNKCGVLVAA